MYRSAKVFAERATADVLIVPDWGVNMELCDIINMYPGQAKDAVKVVKKRLGSKSPIIQLLALSVLDALIKNCGENVIQQIIDLKILAEMATIVRKKPNTNVREKILILIDTWQEAIGVKFPQFIQTFYSLRDAGIEFPPREDSNVTLFTPPRLQPSGHSSSAKQSATPASVKDNISPLSLAEMQNALEVAHVLMEMLEALDLNSNKGINEELIVDMVEQCKGNQKRALSFVNNTEDESLLFQGLTVIDSLERVLRRHEEIANGITITSPVISGSPASPFIGASHWEEEAENDFPHLAPRPQTRRSTSNTEATQANPHATSPSFTMMPNSTDHGVVDYLSGDINNRPFGTNDSYFSSPGLKIPSAPPSPFRYDEQHVYDVSPSWARPSDHTPPASWQHHATTSLSPPQQLFHSHHSSPRMNKESEDALFNELVEFAKARASPSSSTTKSNKPY